MTRLCPACRHADMSSGNAIKDCRHPWFDQPMPATLLEKPESRFIIAYNGVICQKRFVEKPITDCALFEPKEV